MERYKTPILQKYTVKLKKRRVRNCRKKQLFFRSENPFFKKKKHRKSVLFCFCKLAFYAE